MYWFVGCSVLLAIASNVQGIINLVCEHAEMHISCSSGTYIIIVKANYGRTSISDCPGASYNTNCRQSTSLNIMKNRCDGKQSCSVSAHNSVFGDPCVGTVKYLEVEYYCSGTRVRGGGKDGFIHPLI